MRRFSYIFLSILLLCSCGREYEEGDKPNNISFSGGTEAFEANSKLGSTENTIAQRICYSFKTKRTTFSVEKIGSSFDFKVRNFSCNGNDVSQNISTTLIKDPSSQELKFSALSQTSYFSLVQTDLSGYLKETCSEILQGKSGFKSLARASIGYEYTFSAQNDSDQVSIKYGPIINAGENYSVETMLVFKVATANSFGQLQGVVSQASQYIPCPNTSSRVQSLEQTLVGL